MPHAPVPDAAWGFSPSVLIPPHLAHLLTLSVSQPHYRLQEYGVV